jgi:hypothetical protein
MKIPLFALLLTLFSQFASAQYAPGYYIDSTGNKVPGLLKYEFGGNIFTNNKKGACRLVYKPDSASKTTKLSAMEIKGFVIGSDSFTVIHDFRLNAMVYYPQDFVHVLEIGTINLLQYDAVMATRFGSDDINYWILEKDKKGHILGNGNWRKLMEELMADDPDLLEKIKNKDVKYKNIRETIRAYNEYMAGGAGH